jgi:hypothetical protein
MKVLIIGGVAAGTKAAAKLKRRNQNVDVTIITKADEISYAGCGLPYYVGDIIENRDDLIVNSPEKYSALTGVQVLTGREAVSLDSDSRTVAARNLLNGESETYSYDELIIAVGASAVLPQIEGISLPGVFKMRTPDDAEEIRSYIERVSVKKAVIIGAGFIGLEVADNLFEKGIQITVIDSADQILPGVLDSELADYVRRSLAKKGIRFITGVRVDRIVGANRAEGVSTSYGILDADIVVSAAGIRPNTDFLKNCGIEMDRGVIKTDAQLKTNLPHVYAAGDCAMVTNRITGMAQWSPMGSSANMEARTLAQLLTGMDKHYPGVLGTGVVKLPGLNCGRTGLGEMQAAKAGFNVETALAVTDDKAHYYPDSSFFITKLIADKNTHKLLGAQVIGPGAVDKMIDIAVTGINLGARIEDFENADYAYAPPFSTAIHPFVQAALILMNKLDGDLDSFTPAQYAAGEAEGYRVIDVAPSPSLRGAEWIDLTKVDGPVDGLPKDEKLLLVCVKGKRGYFLQRRLKAYGYTNTKVLEGAAFVNQVKIKNAGVAVAPSDIARVKALGFLHDKNTPDKFNCRVITRNGKITSAESKAISEAAEKFGSGELAMTSRMTIEIQGVPYDNIDGIREFLAEHGLETGGTGSKVRPVVSCKGTTCQYGLIDTFAMSEEIHERFYHGYYDVKLPHKFKIAVGGCPNNCVKPDLNDLGIIGQRIPEIDFSKCRGCRICQIEKACPVSAAKLSDGLIHIDNAGCNHCGRCVGKCPFGAVAGGANGYKIYIGGRWGKKTAMAHSLDKIFTDKEEVLSVVEKAILLFREQGITGERFADTVSRLGFENVQSQLLGDALLERKQENIAAEKHLKGGATC